METAQLLVFRFGPDTRFEGQLVGALERIEAAGAAKVIDGLFVARDPESGELLAIDLQRNSAGLKVAPLLSFRLEPGERRQATERALSPNGSGVAAEVVEQLGATLEPGAALVALLLRHTWAQALDDAVARTDGTTLRNELVDGTTLSDLAPELLAAANGSRAST